MAQWIWYNGDFECWHNLQLHLRREERDHFFPPMWRLDSPWHNVQFRKEVELTQPGMMTVLGRGVGMLKLDDGRYPVEQLGKPVQIPVAAGKHRILVRLASNELPCLFVSGAVETDDTWEACPCDNAWKSAGCNAMYTAVDDNPMVFPFRETEIVPAAAEPIDGGVLYDFGRETFAKVKVHIAPGKTVELRYGESRQEALSEAAYLRERIGGEARETVCPERAFRYLWVSSDAPVTVMESLLDVQNRGAFRCSDDLLNRIWDISLRTFHLCSREFYLDGIKRDRWVWSGDAYQSYFINRYCFADKAIDQRTIIALRGKDPMGSHINTILDYSFYWVLSLADDYEATGYAAFVRRLWPMAVSLMDSVSARLDARGLVPNEGNGWIFIDWAELDKEYALCAEQMLLIRAWEGMGQLAAIVGEDGADYIARAEKLRQTVDELYWDEEKGAYIDSFASGQRHVSRHANIFALRFGYAAGEKRERILQNVLMNENVPAIRTPYFKFYELDALADAGDLPEVTRRIREYWGAMVRGGATSIWEEYSPEEPMEAQYGMYGDPFGKSQCHAWGASPVYLCGRWYLGVTPTAPGWAKFDVTPNLGGLAWMEGTVPLPGGEVRVRVDEKGVTATATVPGGTLHWQGQDIPLEAGKTVCCACGE